MSGWIPPRLRPLLGDDLESVDAGRAASLVGMAEDFDLDFKRDPWAATDGGTKEAAYDIAAFANAAGGLIVVGMDEDGLGAASRVVGFDASRDIGLWVQQVVASRIGPPPNVRHVRVPISGLTVFLLSIPPSASGPHAVAVGDGALRFPMRQGNLRRFLGEAEVADRYQRRLSASRDVEKRLSTALADVDTTPGVGDRERAAGAWLAVALVPDVGGSIELSRGLDREWFEWVEPALRDFPCFGPRRITKSIFGFRSIDLHDGLSMSEPYLAAARCWIDGSGLLLFGYLGGDGDSRVPQGKVAVYDEHLIGDVINGLGVLATHAGRTGASGNANIAARLGWASNPMVLAESRSSFPGPIDGLRSVLQTGLSRRSVSLDSLLSGRDRLGAARLVASDLVSSFGLPEPLQVTKDLQIIRSCVYEAWWPWLSKWASSNAVDLI